MLIIQSTGFYKPYQIKVNTTEYHVKNIIIYNEDGTTIESSQGWLEERGSRIGKELREIKLDTDKDIKLKRKIKYDGNIFVVSVEESYSSDKKWDLYIPNSIAGFKKIKRYLSHSNTPVDLYESEKLNAKIETYRHDLRINEKLNLIRHEFNEIKDSYSFSIEEDISTQIDKLKELKLDYDKELERIKNTDLDSLEA